MRARSTIVVALVAGLVLAAGAAAAIIEGTPGDDRLRGTTRGDVLRALAPYIENHAARGGRPYNVLRHILGLYHGQPRARAFRRLLSEQGPRATTGGELIRAVLALVDERKMPAAAE